MYHLKISTRVKLMKKHNGDSQANAFQKGKKIDKII